MNLSSTFSVAFVILHVRDTMSLGSLIRHYAEQQAGRVFLYAADECAEACRVFQEAYPDRLELLPESLVMKGLEHDVVFVADPYCQDEYYDALTAKGGRLVYIPYISVDISGEHLLGTFYNKYVHNTAWKIYVSNEEQAGMFRACSARAEGRNTVNIGTSPKFDYIREAMNGISPEGPARRFLWNIHYDAFPDSQSHQHGRTWSAYLHYHEEMFCFFRDNPKLSLNIRPHPGMFEPAWKRTFDLVTRFLELPGVEIENSQAVGYEESFRKADALVTDLSSLGMVFFLTGKPVVSLACEHSCRINAFAERFFRGFCYHVTEAGNLTPVLEALRDGKDSLRKRRVASLKGDKYFTLSRPACELIAEDIERSLGA